MRAAALTDAGNVRESNQDTVFSSTEPVGTLPNLFFVADGMGGHKAGGYCSSMLKERLIAAVRAASGSSPVRVFSDAVAETNRALFHEASEREELSGMGSTLTAAFLEDGLLHVFNIGDSRLYTLSRGGELRQITRDHSYVEELVSAGRLERGSREYNRNKNIITRAVGIGERAEMDAFEVSAEEMDAFLLCTDGLSNMLPDAEIARTIRENESPEAAARELIRLANRRGGSDNVSVVLVYPFREEATA